MVVDRKVDTEMSDLIDRQSAINVLEILADKMSDEGQTVMAQAVAVLKDLHSEKPEQKKGEWMFAGKQTKLPFIGICSVCGHYESAVWIISHRPNFCPECGAKLEWK